MIGPKSVLLLFLSGFAFVSAQPAADQTPPQVRKEKLRSTQFDLAGLTLIFGKLDDSVIFSDDRRDVGVGFVRFRLDNRTDQFITFDPTELVFVGENGGQASIGLQRREEDRAPAEEIRMAPGAHVYLEYNLTARLYFPVKVYYNAKLIAEVTD